MIDVTFQLIIFFLLSSRLTEQETRELDLPLAASGRHATSDDRPRTLITVSADGRMTIASAEVTPAELLNHLQAQREQLGRDLEVRIRADRAVTYGAVEPILLACAQARIWNVTFAVSERIEGRASRVKSRNR